MMVAEQVLTDAFNRSITYLRLSLTDRCNFRCVYCMAEDMTFLPKSNLLTFEEILAICRAFTELGVKKIRLTGGEPLVRKDVVSLIGQLSVLPQLEQLAMTSNGALLPQMADALYKTGLDSLNISLDTLNATRFKSMTRNGDLAMVIRGIDAAKSAGFTQLKLNAVILRGQNDDEILDLVHFALEKQVDITFIEEMPLGVISSHQRAQAYVSSEEIRNTISQHFDLTPLALSTGGPARYFAIDGCQTRLGFISPHSQNFCASCNRVRLTSEGQLLLCLGNENAVDLRACVRQNPGDIGRLKQLIIDAMAHKPEKHHFTTDGDVYILRFMNTTGG